MSPSDKKPTSTRLATWYKLVYSETNPAPSYLGGDPAWAVISDRATDRVVVDGLVPGTTHFVRLQAIRSTALGAFVVAETEVLTYTAPLSAVLGSGRCPGHCVDACRCLLSSCRAAPRLACRPRAGSRRLPLQRRHRRRP